MATQSGQVHSSSGLQVYITYSVSTSATATSVTWTAVLKATKSYSHSGVFSTVFSVDASWFTSDDNDDDYKSGTYYEYSKNITSLSKGKTITVGPYTHTLARAPNAYGLRSISINAAVTEFMDQWSSASVDVTVPSLQSYAVNYYGNGATSGVPARQTKWYNRNLTLSSTKPYRVGYDFVRWNTNSAGTGTNYNPGQVYSANAALNLYAQWSIWTYKIAYNANGDNVTNVPATQTKNYNTNLTLSTVVPVRPNYLFKGWYEYYLGGRIDYAPGAIFTDNRATTLYAQWEPVTSDVTMSSCTAFRCTQLGELSDDDDYIKVNGRWSNGREYNAANGVYDDVQPYAYQIDYDYIDNGATVSHTTGKQYLTSAEMDQLYVERILSLGTDTQQFTYTITFTVYFSFYDSITDEKQAVKTTYVSPAFYALDVNADGSGIAFGQAVGDEDDALIIYHNNFVANVNRSDFYGSLLSANVERSDFYGDMYLDLSTTNQSDIDLRDAIIALGWGEDCLTDYTPSTTTTSDEE